MVEKEVVLGLAAEIVSAHVRNNAVPTDQLPTLIKKVFNTLVTAEQTSFAPPRPEPAVPINRSMRADYLTCLDCGKHLSMLKRHLRMDHQLTPQQYRQRWGLPGAWRFCFRCTAAAAVATAAAQARSRTTRAPSSSPATIRSSSSAHFCNASACSGRYLDLL
jgi:predicted transcriptional regulator